MKKLIILTALMISMCMSPGLTSQSDAEVPEGKLTAEVISTELPVPNDSNYDDLQYIAEFDITAFCACEYCCGSNADGITATGTKATEGRTISVDPDVIPLGSKVYIEDYGCYVAEDTGSAIKGHIIDMYMVSHEAALQFGRQHKDVYIVK